MAGIFISYRRSDIEGYAGRLFEGLGARFGQDMVFFDVAGIEPGQDFHKVIGEKVRSCNVLLALIGNSWASASDGDGQRRLDDPRILPDSKQLLRSKTTFLSFHYSSGGSDAAPGAIA